MKRTEAKRATEGLRKMNERIRELAEQAGAVVCGTFGKPMNIDELEKFAELIVKEFAELIVKESAELIVRECILALWTEECRTSDLAILDHNRNVKKIKEHFGVEENELNNNRL
jgi:hypothetical protein